MPEELNIGLSNEQRESVGTILSKILGNQHVLYMKMRNYHWNLTGPRFHTLHEFYEKEYDALAKAIDETAERVRMIGGVSPGSMGEMLQLATLDEAEGALIDGSDSIKALVDDHEACIRDLRGAISTIEEDYRDVGTADFLVELLQAHEQSAWMLRSFMS